MGSRSPSGRAPRLFVFLFVILAAAASAGDVLARNKAPWERIVIIGASVSRGFTAYEPFGGPKTKELALDRYLNAALLAPHEPPRNLANAMFFMLPDDMGHEQIRQASTNQPTLIVGIDFLFWFCYGHGRTTDQDRLEHFEKGLKLLEQVNGPLIVGDIPDASAAVNRMLSPREIPSPRARAAANRRLRQWAERHKQVTVVPLGEFMRAVTANKALTVHGHVFPAGQTRALLQEDRLHPGKRGCAALAVSILDAFMAGHPGLDVSDVRWDPEEVWRLAAHSDSTAQPAQGSPGPKP